MIRSNIRLRQARSFVKRVPYKDSHQPPRSRALLRNLFSYINTGPLLSCLMQNTINNHIPIPLRTIPRFPSLTYCPYQLSPPSHTIVRSHIPKFPASITPQTSQPSNSTLSRHYTYLSFSLQECINIIPFHQPYPHSQQIS